QEALRRCMGKPDFAEELAGIFVNETLPMYLPGLEEGFEKKEFAMVARNAHGIKGGSAAIGLMRARKMAYALEMAGRKEDMDMIVQLMPLLREELDQVTRMIKEQGLLDGET
ncbi:MAG: Hpt domain-containing protein, partial [Desulfonatronovibrionaceae bacterium]